MKIADEMRAGLLVVWSVLKFDSAALQTLDNTPFAAARSFRAAVVGLPFYLVVINRGYEILPVHPEPVHFFLSAMLLYAIEWLAWPNVAEIFTRRMGCQQFYCRHVVAYNWFALAKLLMLLPFNLALLSPAPAANIGSVAMLALIAFEIYEWFIAKHTLGLTSRGAVVIVLLQLLTRLVLFGLPLLVSYISALGAAVR